MQVIHSIEEMRAASRELRRAGKSLGLVPTMGALHEGHLSLVRSARARCQAVAVSIFVNPLQFGPQEDFSKYPRSFERDRQLLESENVDLIFAPSAEEMYRPEASTVVLVEDLSDRLDGRSRPGHFRGVATVVAKLFHIAQPDVAFFGQKDAAQVAVLRRMVRDLDFGIEMVICPTVRERDGLAMSSRNAYLTPEQRKQALVLYRALMRVQFLSDRGERDAAALLAAAREVLAEEPAVRVDYVEMVDTDTLVPVATTGSGALLAIAAYVGTTRLIDNLVVFPASDPVG